MMRRQVGAMAVLVACCWLLLAVPTAGLGAGTPAQVNNTTDTPDDSFGQQISSFMQTSAVDANASVERGMWQASVNRTVEEQGDPAPEVTNRIARLERKLQQLRNRSRRLADRRDRLPPVAYAAQASALREQIANLRADIDAATRTATRAGLNTSRLDRLRSVAENATGPELPAAARNITDVPRGPPATVPGRGPPEDVGPGENGPPEDVGSEEGGPPEDVGPEKNRTVPPGGQTPANEPMDDDDAARNRSTDEEQSERDNRERGNSDDDQRGERAGNGDADEENDDEEDEEDEDDEDDGPGRGPETRGRGR
jgi:hypothetical protein